MQGMNYCPNCGKQRNGTEKFCSNCGTRLYQLGNMPHSKKQQFLKTNGISTIWISAVIVLAVFYGVSRFKVDNSDKSPLVMMKREMPKYLSIRKTTYSIQSIKDINKMEEAIKNTVWTRTEEGDFWLKLEFLNGTVKIYRAFPIDGHWTFDEECPYTLEEGRFIDDGRRYIAAVIRYKELSIPPKFVITNGHLSWLGIIDAGGFILGDYEWD